MSAIGRTGKAAPSVEAPIKKQNIPVQMTNLAIFDDTYAFMKERFSEEMKRVDEQMLQLGKAMTHYYNQKLTVQTGLTSTGSVQSLVDWETIASSPLVEGEGQEKMLKLQFDLSQFDPEEVAVKISNDVLTVSATHDEKDEKYAVYREYNREFLLPRGTDPDHVISSLSRDGVLTVQAPLLNPVPVNAPPPRAQSN